MKEMKIVRNYKRLKKWAKTLFVTLLTICIVFTSTGVATLFAYADPADENNEPHEHSFTSTEYVTNNDGTHKVIKKCDCDFTEESTETCDLLDGVCDDCGYSELANDGIDDNSSNENMSHGSSEDNSDSFQSSNNSAETSPVLRQQTDTVLRNAPVLESNQETPESLGITQELFFSGDDRPYAISEEFEYTGSVINMFHEAVWINQLQSFMVGDSTAELRVGSYIYKLNGQQGNNYEYYKNAISLGTYTMIAKADIGYIPHAEHGTFINDTLTSEYEAKIVAADISKERFSITNNNISYSEYRSGSKKLGIHDSTRNYNLVEGTDYTTDDSQIPSILDVGESYSVTLTGIGNYQNTLNATIKAPEDISITYTDKDNNVGVKDSYIDQVTIKASGYNISYNSNGPFDDKIVYTEPGKNKDVTLYFKDAGGNIYRKAIKLTVTETIPVKYNGKEVKETSYIEKVDITADGYTLSISKDGPFASTYTHKTIGTNQVIELWFRSNQTGGEPIKKTITGITILSKDVTAIGESTGKIIIGDYSSDKIAATESIAYKTRDTKSIEIQATNENSGIASIEYATSNEAYNTVSDILGAVIDKKMNWKPYSNDGKPTFPKDSALYVYARITDNDGNYNYLSTGKIIHDTVDPEITNAILAAKEDGSNENVLVITAKDTLSGIDEFYMLYEPKNENSKTPKKEDIIEKGKTSSVDASEGENFGGSYKLSDLIEDTTYIFYIVAKDEVGNISEIKTIESKGKGSSKSYGADSSSSATASSGLTPAPNGIAGPGNNKTPKTGTTGIPQKTSQEVNVSSLDREINRIPYISDATGDTKIGIDATGGWDKITNEVKNASPGISMDVEMSGFSVVPDKVFSTMMGKNLNVKFLMPEDVEWIINGQNIKSTSGTDLDLGVRIGAKNIPSDMLNPVVGAYPHTEIELKHNGTFGFSGILRIPLGKSNAGLYAYLYYYDTKEKEMKLMQSTQISSTGYAEFEFNHASDYSIVIRGEEMTTVGTAKSNNALEGEDTNVDNSSAHKTFRLTDFAGSRASVRMWLFMIAIISAVMCGLILYMPGLKDEETLEKV